MYIFSSHNGFIYKSSIQKVLSILWPKIAEGFLIWMMRQPTYFYIPYNVLISTLTPNLQLLDDNTALAFFDLYVL